MKSVSIDRSCPFCGTKGDPLIEKFGSDVGNPIYDLAQSLMPTWQAKDGICGRCLDKLHLRVSRQISSGENEIVTPLPTALRLNASNKYSGKGVTICMIDSGFYAHADIKDRILNSIDIPTGNRKGDFNIPHHESWHGTMTSVVAAGNGKLSAGLYKGIAHEADLVLVKVMNRNGISSVNITKAIECAIQNQEKYQIKIINLSITDDWPISHKESSVDMAVEKAIERGITVVAAVGNDQSAAIKPPANSPGVISVGGINDYNTLGFEESTAYHSTFGKTIDYFSKPELISPSIWIPVPILPETDAHLQATALFRLYECPGSDFWTSYKNNSQIAGLDPEVKDASIFEIRSLMREKIKAAKFVSGDYMHGDGTSFAAPIVSSIVAQMIEANPDIRPSEIKSILSNTAQFLPHIPAERQGFGLVNPGLAVKRAELEVHSIGEMKSPVIDYENNRIIFIYHNDMAEKIELTGSFFQWEKKVPLRKNKTGLWKKSISMLPEGHYFYKFIIDEKKWTEDSGNLYKEPDGHNGFNSTFFIQR